MHRRLLAALACIAVLLGLVSAPAGAQLSEGEIQIVDLDASAYPEIQVVVDVPRSFADTTLSAKEFSLDEGGVAREISVEKLDESTGIVLAIDTSGSMASGDAISVARQSALQFVDGLPANHPVAVVGFGDQVTRVSELTTDRAQTRSAIESLGAGGETSLYDALVDSAGILASAGTDRVALVVLSDGADTASSATPAQAIGAIQVAGVSLYAIGLETGESQLTELRSLSDSAGGTFLSTTDLADLATVYDGLAARLANQYRLRFEATSSGPVDIRVVALSNGRLAVAETVTTLRSVPGQPGTTTDPGTTPADQVFDAVPFMRPPAGMLEEGWVMWAGLGALFFAFSTVSYAAFSMNSNKPRRRLEPRATPTQTQGAQLSGVASWASGLVDRTFLNSERRGAMNSALDRAGLNLRPGEFIVLVGCVSVGALGVGWLVHPFVGAGAAIVVALSARSFVAFLGARRRTRFANQLDSTLLVLASSLRAGHGIQRALVAVAEESDAPTGEEFTRVVAETRIGRDLVEALQGVADRLGNEDFEWVVRAVAINRELGGNLSEVLDNVGSTIRERNQLRRQVSALSAEGKLSAMVLYVLPFGVAGFVQMTNPEYLGELTGNNAGIGMIVGAFLLMIAGGAWIKKIVQVQF